VCTVSGDLASSVLDGLAALVDQSLLRQQAEAEGEPRFTMLETIREYAAERLAQSGESAMLRRRHLEYYLGLAAESDAALKSADQGAWLARLEAEHDNLRSALSWAIDQSIAPAAQQMAGELFRFWWLRGHLAEGRRWLRSALSLPGGAAEDRARALNAEANLAWAQVDYEQAKALHRQALTLRQELGDQAGIAGTYNNLGMVYQHEGRYAEAAELYDDALTIMETVGDRWAIGLMMGNLGGVLGSLGQYERATTLCETSLEILRELGDKLSEARMINNLVFVAMELEEYGRAAQLQKESLLLCFEMGNRDNLGVCLENAARIAAAQGKPDALARLWGAADALREELGQQLPPAEREAREQYADMALRALDPESFRAAELVGRELPLSQVVVFALTTLSAG
jgi:tetratricopeptide (TPR) repeat protein